VATIPTGKFRELPFLIAIWNYAQRKRDMTMRSAAAEVRILSRRSKVADLLLRGTRCQLEICRQLGMEPSQRRTIGRDIAALNEEWKQQAAVSFDEFKGKELARLDMIETAAWKGWERSLLDDEMREAMKEGDKERSRKSVRGQAGDPRFLNIALQCVRERREILGLKKPESTDEQAEDREVANLLLEAQKELDAFQRRNGTAPGDGTDETPAMDPPSGSPGDGVS
jgi:hypothetical protein